MATAIFLLAVMHTFVAPKFAAWAHRLQHDHDARSRAAGKLPRPSIRAETLHFLGEIEAVFGLWAAVLLVAVTLAEGWEQIHALARGEWVTTPENLIFAGPIGTGTTHLAIALGVEATKQKRRVLFTRAADLVRQLVEARDARELTRLQRRLLRVDVVIIDELGFVPFDRHGGELLFNLITDRYERRATVVTTNLAFAEWVRAVGSAVLQAEPTAWHGVAYQAVIDVDVRAPGREEPSRSRTAPQRLVSNALVAEGEGFESSRPFRIRDLRNVESLKPLESLKVLGRGTVSGTPQQ